MLFGLKQGLVLVLTVYVHKAVRDRAERCKRHELAVDAAEAFAGRGQLADDHQLAVIRLDAELLKLRKELACGFARRDIEKRLDPRLLLAV